MTSSERNWFDPAKFVIGLFLESPEHEVERFLGAFSNDVLAGLHGNTQPTGASFTCAE